MTMAKGGSKKRKTKEARARERREKRAAAKESAPTYAPAGLDGRRRQARASLSFAAEWPGSCQRCLGRIEPGDICHYTAEGELVHSRHPSPPPRKVDICETCWLTKPCECD